MNIAIIRAGNAFLILMDRLLSNANIEIVGVAEIKGNVTKCQIYRNLPMIIHRQDPPSFWRR